MKPLNETERRTLYFQFLALYLISIALIIVTMHFFYTVPQKELKVLREQKEKFKSYDAGPRVVLRKMQTADSLLKQISDPGAKEITKNEEDLKKIFSDIKSLGDEKKNAVDSMFVQVSDNYFKLFEAKGKERSGSGANQTLAEMTRTLNETKDKLRECETTKQTLQTIVDNNK